MRISVVTLLLLANGLMFVAELINAPPLVGLLALWPYGLFEPVADSGAPSFWPWQILSYAFLHGSLLHLLLNMYALWLFGSRLEQRWGAPAFALFYFSCVIGAGLTHLVVGEVTMLQGGTAYPVIGASGGVFGLLLAFGVLFPQARLMLLIPPIPITAKWLVIVYGAIELFAGVTGTAEGIAHFAHLGGMLTGWLLLRRWHDGDRR